MEIVPYIHFNGSCREAVEFYAEVFHTAPPRLITFADAKDDPVRPMPEEAKRLVMHAQIEVNGQKLMFSDTFPGMPYEQGNHITIAVMPGDKEEAKRIFSCLKKSGKVEMELQETEWSGCYGFLTDRYGIGWQISVQG